MAGHDNPQLDLILHSPGAEPFQPRKPSSKPSRGRYEHIRVFVPQRAMSAAAMLACAADQIIMSGFASLSPTNPLVVVPTMGGSMMLPAQAVVDERNELLHRLQGPDGTREDLMSLVAQPPGMFHDARRIISESRLTVGRVDRPLLTRPRRADAQPPASTSPTGFPPTTGTWGTPASSRSTTSAGTASTWTT